MAVNKERCSELKDSEIITLSLRDLDYFACLYERYEATLLRYIKRIAWIDEEEARDILQDSFIKIWRHLNDYDPHLKLSSWMYRIVHNETVSFLRKKQSYGKNRTTEIHDLRMDLAQEEDTTGEAEDRLVLTREVLEAMPGKYRDVLVLKFLEEKSYEEISDILRIPEGTVATRINRAKKAFMKIAENKK